MLNSRGFVETLYSQKAVEYARHINRASEEDTLFMGMAQYWFACFFIGDYDVEVQHGSGRPSGLDHEPLHELAKDDLQHTTRTLVEAMKISQPTVIEHRRALGFVS